MMMVIGSYTDKNGFVNWLYDESTFGVYDDELCTRKRNHQVGRVVVGETYKIDGNEVDYMTFVNAIEKEIIFGESHKGHSYKDAWDAAAHSWNIIEDVLRGSKGVNTASRYPWGGSKKTVASAKNTKGDFNMPKIKNYTYIMDHGVTIIEWSDGTKTKVVCDPEKADQFTGFVSAVAKKAFGNGGKMLDEWDRLVIKPIEDAKKAEEKARIEAEEERIHAEAKAKRAAKKAERKKKREIENLAKQIADAYHEQELLEEAEELATKKYGVPKVYLDSHNTCSCGCCEELGTMTDEDVTD